MCGSAPASVNYQHN